MSNDAQANERISVSLSTLRAELSQLELRLVDRLNAALAHKADATIQEQLAQRMADISSRVGTIENTMVKRDGPIVQRVEQHDQEIGNLRAVGGYKKWLWAQTIALVAIAIPLIAWAYDTLKT